MYRVIITRMVCLCLFVKRMFIPRVLVLNYKNNFNRIKQKAVTQSYQSSIKAFLVLTSLFVLSGCQGIKVGDVKFSATEICSREYVEPYWKFFDNYTLGCLPPQRHDQVSKFRFSINRPLLSPQEAIEISKAAPEISTTGVQLTKANPASNLAPTFIGRLFEIHNIKNKDKPEPPASGSFTFPPLNFNVNLIPTPVLLSTEVYANAELKRKIGVKANIGAVINTYLKANYPAIPVSVENSIKEMVAEFERETDINNLSFGKFQYVSIKEELLDQILQELQNRCLIGYFDEDGKKLDAACSPKKEVFKSKISVNEYVNDIENRLKLSSINESKKNYGFIIGASILNTSGESSTCNTTGVGLGNVTGDPISVSSCAALANKVKSILDKVSQSKPSGSQQNSDSNEVDVIKNMTSDQKTEVATKLASAYINSKAAALKTLKLESHSSILAIHYILLRLPGN